MESTMTRGLKIAAAASGSFSALVVLILVLLVSRIVTLQLALLMVVALVALYFGCGVLIAVYRFIAKLE
jgi:hypothetical protein